MEGFTALAAAVANGQTECVRVLLARGADPSIPTADGRAPVFLAASVGHLPALRLLLDSFGLNRATESWRPDTAGRNPVMAATANGKVGCLRALVEVDLEETMRRLLPCGMSAGSAVAGERLDDLLVVEERATIDTGEALAAPAWGAGERALAAGDEAKPLLAPASVGNNSAGGKAGGGGGGGIDDVDNEGRSALMHACMFDQVYALVRL